MVIMHSFFLKFKVIFVALLIVTVGATAQNARFIYLQTENKEEFYVKLDKKLLNSSPSGYLIIPRLSENLYTLTIGFYLGGMPEITTSVKIKDVSLGYLLKNTADKGWTMVNLQTMQPAAIKKEVPQEKQETAGPNVDEFTRILAEVVDEPSIAWGPVIKTNDVVVQPIKKAEEKKPDIPTPKIDSVIVKKADVAVKEIKPVTPVPAKVTNSKCKRTASQTDFIRLRKQMAGEANEKSMIKAANKQFLLTCYTTEQVRNLSILFINEEEKYKFFVAAYPYVADTNNFGSLQELLTDNYYKTRLNAMLRN